MNVCRCSVANPIKIYTGIIYGFSYYARKFVPCKPFLPSLMFVGKARDLPYSGAPQSCFTRVLQVLHSRLGSWPYLETSGKSCQGQTLLAYYENLSILTVKSFIGLAHGTCAIKNYGFIVYEIRSRLGCFLARDSVFVQASVFV
jgi:hypothetical protein